MIRSKYVLVIPSSDGIGCSGTFCALVASINRFKAEQMVDVFKTIITMRTQRPGLVANAVRNSSSLLLLDSIIVLLFIFTGAVQIYSRGPDRHVDVLCHLC